MILFHAALQIEFIRDPILLCLSFPFLFLLFLCSMDFKKELKLFDAVMHVAVMMIGSGIFIVSSEMAKELGSSGWLIVAWLLSGLITVIGALSYGGLSSMSPHADGQYIGLAE
jgi:APA family basic amino acid/polyamine antiporter